MKFKAIMACTTLVGAGLICFTASPALAGCGVTIEGHNLTAADVTIDWADSDVRTSTTVFGVRIPGPWKKIGTGTLVISPGAMKSKAFTLDFQCAIDREYRLEANQNGGSWFEYFPSATTWTRDITPHVDIN